MPASQYPSRSQTLTSGIADGLGVGLSRRTAASMGDNSANAAASIFSFVLKVEDWNVRSGEIPHLCLLFIPVEKRDA